jgi:hypothetical protein
LVEHARQVGDSVDHQMRAGRKQCLAGGRETGFSFVVRQRVELQGCSIRAT